MKTASQTFEMPTVSSPPLLIWCIVVMLAIEGVGNLLMVPTQPIALWWLIAKVFIIGGLLRGYRWMFYLFIAIAAYHAFYFWDTTSLRH